MGIKMLTLVDPFVLVEEPKPNPPSIINGFEGVEKRLEVGFQPFTTMQQFNGLRGLRSDQIHNLLELVDCTIVSKLHNDAFDSFVLSESSLFIYPYRLILKTCGKTQLLKCISLLLSYAFKLSLHPCFCKYTHGAFIFPRDQPFPYTSFKEETKYLDTFFGHMGSEAYTMDMNGNQIWHIYSAATHDYTKRMSNMMPLYTLEMCMTDLDQDFCSNFLNPTSCKTGKDMTRDSGLADILPQAVICDYAFVPCGYSMNGLEGSALSTIHITPEETHSYASFEVMGYDPHSLDLQVLIGTILSMFKPRNVVMSLHVSCCYDDMTKMVTSSGSWGLSVVPQGYGCEFSQKEEMPGNSKVVFHNFSRDKEFNMEIAKPLLTISNEKGDESNDNSEEDWNQTWQGAIVGCSKSYTKGKRLRGRQNAKNSYEKSSILQIKQACQEFNVKFLGFTRPCKCKVDDSNCEVNPYGDSNNSSFTSNLNSSEDEKSHSSDEGILE